MENLTIKAMDVITLGGSLLAPLVLWGIKLIYTEIKAIRADLKDYVTQHQCELHRQIIEEKIKGLRRRAPRSSPVEGNRPPPPALCIERGEPRGY